MAIPKEGDFNLQELLLWPDLEEAGQTKLQYQKEKRRDRPKALLAPLAALSAMVLFNIGGEPYYVPGDFDAV